VVGSRLLRPSRYRDRGRPAKLRLFDCHPVV
jgi:hypothetical protein